MEMPEQKILLEVNTVEASRLITLIWRNKEAYNGLRRVLCILDDGIRRIEECGP
jgi:hypothetical protein